MKNRLNLIVTGATAAMLLMPMKTDAQKLETGLRRSIPTSVAQQFMKTTPATRLHHLSADGAFAPTVAEPTVPPGTTGAPTGRKQPGSMAKAASRANTGTVAPPYFEGFDTEEALAGFTIIDSNNDDNTWEYYAGDNNSYVRYRYSSANKADDWLITPAIRVEKGKAYVVKFKARSNITYYMERLEVKYGKGNTAAAMTHELLPATDLAGEGFVEYSKEIQATEDGTLHIGFHAISDANRYSLDLDDISVDVGLASTAPDAVDDLVATAGDRGAKSVTLTFTAPSKSINGSALSGKVNLKLYRDGEMIKEFNGVVAGSKQTYTDADAKEGLNSYCLSTENADGAGRTSQPVKVYVGVDKPTYPDVFVADNLTSVAVSWTDKERGVNGGYVDRDKLAHKFYTLEDGSSGLTPNLEAEIPAGKNTYEVDCITNEGEQELVRFGVSAVSNGTESAIGISPAMIVGKPYDVPFFESVAGGDLMNDMWWVLSDRFTLGEARPSSDGDDGCIAMISGADDGYGMLGSGKINIAGTNDPTLIFSHMAKAGSNARIVVSVQKPDGTVEDLKTVNADADDGKWTRETIKLKQEYTSLPYIILRFTGMAKNEQVILLDEFYVRDVYETDLSLADIAAPARMKKGETAKVDISVCNFGSRNAKDYTVKFYAGGQLADSKKETAELAPYETKTYSFQYASNVMIQESSIELKAEVEFAEDQNPEDNTKTVTVEFSISDKPRPADVTATDNGSGSVSVKWSAATETATSVEENFESYNSWIKDEIGNWTGVVGSSTPENAKTSGLFLTFAYPGQGSRFAFTVVDPLNNWITETMLGNTPALKAHSGDKYIASFQKFNGDPFGEDFYDADNWIISPSLSGNRQTVSFWVSNLNDGYSTYPETFDVMYSKEGPHVDKFVKIGKGHTVSSGKWTEVRVEIPEGSTRFAIHQNTKKVDNFMFMLDDFKYEAGSGKIIGYRIYRDGTLLNTVDADKTEFTDETAGMGKTYVYGVTALYGEGESETAVAEAITTGIKTAETAGATSSYDVFTIDGRLIGRGMKTLKNLKNGSYIINNQKVIVE